MNSRWQANKIGLINFWYYDEQEFPFIKGRMLLRGSNGSGKSVTMQSVVPLLLDGNMSPERLDPFGSRDRKMSSYLLEEDDGREERTGYLYLEFKREESETYLTVGMGIRARRGKPLDKWYFGLTDGRRIGHDFLLYKETDEKVPLSRKELENRIQNGGQVFDRQAEYMEFMNRQVFGFETVDEYREMIDLLIQLRTPKLSKDFKPSVINEILSDSLQPLSDEDLRPMSEAIENMDTMNMNLKSRQEGLQAAEKINRVFDRYNRLMLFEKANRYESSRTSLLAMQKDDDRRRKEMEQCRARMEELAANLTELDAKKAAMEKERESLNKSDAVGLKQKEMELSRQILEKEEQKAQKEKQLAEKNDRHIQIQSRHKDEEDKEFKKKQELEKLLAAMKEDAGEMEFQEHGFFASELEEHFGENFSFDTHQQQFDRTFQAIEEGVGLFRQVDAKERERDEIFQKREKLQRETDAKVRRANELEASFVQAQNEWKEALYSWNGSNRELKLAQEHLHQLAQFAENYTEESDFGKARQTVANVWIDKKGELDTAVREKRAASREIADELKEQERQLAEWENHKEPVPFRSEAVLKNRERLSRMNIPYQEFYKVIEFAPELSKEACDRLEEAFSYMGILDALVIEEQYKEQVLAAEDGCHDQYLFVQNQRASKSVLDVLELNDAVNDIFSNQRITGILSCIAYDGDGITSVSSDGTYRIGVLTGTLTGEYEAGFLGTRAREQNRQAQIARCKAAIAECEASLSVLGGEIDELVGRAECLELEYEAFPQVEKLRQAYRRWVQELRMADQLRAEVQQLDEKLRAVTEVLKEIKQAALAIADRLYLTGSLASFLGAEQAARRYGNDLVRLKSGHELYLGILASMENLDEQLAQLEDDMDQIRYEAGRVERDLSGYRQEHLSVTEQLKLTDYEQIRERLDACVKWLEEYPSVLLACGEEKAQKAEQILALGRQCEAAAALMEEQQKKGEHLRRCYEEEYKLSYVELPEEFSGNAKDVLAYLAPTCQNLEKEKIIGNLNEAYFENRGFLTDYQPVQTELFDELDEQGERNYPAAKRWDIQAKYQGVRISFSRLPAYLKQEIADLQELIKSGDRELFEDILANTVSRKIRSKINASNTWVDKMNSLMGAMNTSSGLRLSLRWRSRTAESEDQLDTRELVELLKKDYRLMREEEAQKLSTHFRSKVDEARRHAQESGGTVSFYQVMKDTLDYRKWFEFQLFSQKSGERLKELTNSVFGTFSGGEKAMSMYVPLFSAVVAKYQGGRADAPRLISLDEAFAGVDNKNIRDMFRLMTEFRFDFIINSQVLWGDCDTLDALAIYQLLRPENAKFVTVMPYLWNGKAKEMLEDEQEMEQRAAEFAG